MAEGKAAEFGKTELLKDENDLFSIVFSRKHGEGSSAKTLGLLHKLDT